MVNLLVFEGNAEDKETHVYVNVNGKTALLKRGQTVRCPRYLR